MFGFGGETNTDGEITKGTQAVQEGLFDRSKSTEFQGYLTKQSMWLKVLHNSESMFILIVRCFVVQEWRRRYFMLKGHHLFFGKDAHGEPHGVIDLLECRTVRSLEARTGKRHGFEVITPETTFYMYAETENDKDEWICTLQAAILRHSKAYTNYDEKIHEY